MPFSQGSRPSPARPTLTPARGGVLVAALALGFAACSEGHPGRESIGAQSSAITPIPGCDYSFARPSPSSLVSMGYKFVARYLSGDPGSGKDLTKAEADSLTGAGLDVVLVWETTGDDALSGYNAGVSDAQAASSEAAAVGAPASRPIYFALDFDEASSQSAAVDEYFKGVASVIGLSRTGAYGGYYAVNQLFNGGLITWGWQTYAWSGGSWDSRAQLRQTQNGLDGDQIDGDEAEVSDYGQWGPGAPSSTPDYAAEFVSQSFPLASTALKMVEGQTIPSFVEMKNTGTKTWDSSTRLATTEPENRTSVFADGSWLAPDRPAAVTGTVAPGATYKFQFNLHAPTKTGTYKEYFGMVQEAVVWFSAAGEGGPADNFLEAQIVVGVPSPRGNLDEADCTTIAGWTEEQIDPTAALRTDIYFNGAAGSAGTTAFSVTAGNHRADLCTAIGSCDHGFSMVTPRGVMDGATHSVYAYGINPLAGGSNTLLPGAPKNVKCTAPSIPSGDVKRHVTSPTILGDWRFDTFQDEAPYTTAEIAAVPDGVDLASPPKLVQVTGAPAIYVVDDGFRRHVTDPTSFAAWRFESGDVAPITASALAALVAGPDWPAGPLLAKDPTAPAIYMLDVPLPSTDGGAPDGGFAAQVDAGGGGIVFVDGGVLVDGSIVTPPAAVPDGGGLDAGSVVDAGGDVTLPITYADASVIVTSSDGGSSTSHASSSARDGSTGGGGAAAESPGSSGGCSVTREAGLSDIGWFAIPPVAMIARSRRRRVRSRTSP